MRWIVALTDLDGRRLDALERQPGLTRRLDAAEIQVWEVDGWRGEAIADDGTPVALDHPVAPLATIDSSEPTTWHRAGGPGWLRGLSPASVTDDGLLGVPGGSGPAVVLARPAGRARGSRGRGRGRGHRPRPRRRQGGAGRASPPPLMRPGSLLASARRAVCEPPGDDAQTAWMTATSAPGVPRTHLALASCAAISLLFFAVAAPAPSVAQIGSQTGYQELVPPESDGGSD